MCDKCHKGGIDGRPCGVRQREWSRMTRISDSNNWGMSLTENTRGGSGGAVSNNVWFATIEFNILVETGSKMIKGQIHSSQFSSPLNSPWVLTWFGPTFLLETLLLP